MYRSDTYIYIYIHMEGVRVPRGQQRRAAPAALDPFDCHVEQSANVLELPRTLEKHSAGWVARMLEGGARGARHHAWFGV